MSRSRLAVTAAATAAGFALLSACSGYGSDTSNAAPVAVQRQAAASEGQAAAVGATKLTAAEIDGLGTVLTEQNGLTLYRFDKDTAKPAKSNCDGDCATTWPPLLAEGSVQVQGVDQKLVGTVTRTDGTQQITVNGWPVYKYAKDTTQGEAKGQGVGGTWNAITPTGGKAAPAAAPAQEAAATQVIASQIDGLGSVLTDKNGMTLYLFTKDVKDSGKSACNGDCATTWPPLIAEGDVQLQGVDQKLLSTVKRQDGTEQIEIGGWPVYRYSKDTAPGQANGHGVGGTWFVIESNGCKVGAEKQPTNKSSSGSSGSSGDSGGYSY